MGAQTLRVFTCDRCRTEESSTSQSFQPSHWATVRITNPPLMAPDEPPTKSFMLCRPCRQHIERSLEPLPIAGEEVA